MDVLFLMRSIPQYSHVVLPKMKKIMIHVIKIITLAAPETSIKKRCRFWPFVSNTQNNFSGSLCAKMGNNITTQPLVKKVWLLNGMIIVLWILCLCVLCTAWKWCTYTSDGAYLEKNKIPLSVAAKLTWNPSIHNNQPLAICDGT